MAAFELLAQPQPRGPLSHSSAGRGRHGCRGRDFDLPTASNPILFSASRDIPSRLDIDLYRGLTLRQSRVVITL